MKIQWKFKGALFVGFLLVLLLLLGVGKLNPLCDATSNLSFAQAPDPIRIGALLPFTGPLSEFGAIYYDVIQLAVVQINKAGGVLGRDLEVVFKDTGTSPSTGKTAAAQLVVYDKVPAIVGPVASVVTIPVAESVTIPGKVVLISPTATSPQITDLKDNDYVFRTVISDAFQAIVQTQLAMELGYKTVSIIYVDNPYGQGIARAFKEDFEAQGGRILAMVPHVDRLKSSYRTEVSLAIKNNPDALNVVSYASYGNVILADAKELGYKGGFIFSDGMRDEFVAGGPAGDYIEGAYGTAPTDFHTGVLSQFQADYNREYGSTSLPYTPQVYDAVVLIALAIQAAGEATGTAIRDHLREVANPPGVEVTYGELATAFSYLRQGRDINYQGVSGPITFDEHGDVTDGAIEIWRIENGHIETVRTTQVTQGEAPNQNPVATFTSSPSDPRVGEPVTFDASDSHDPDGSIVRYEWDFGDSTTKSGKRVTHAYSSPGRYKVTLTVTDNRGAMDSAFRFVTVQEPANQPPIARFSYSPSEPVVNMLVTFDASECSDPDGSIVLYEWDFGDGSPKNYGMIVTHAFSTGGTYTVKLTVTDDDGATASVEQEVKVLESGGGGGPA